jgi:hypothetical protein
MLEAYFDESDTHGEAFVTTIAGYVATKDTWTALEARWRSVLKDLEHLDAKTFHMYDCIMGQGEFGRVLDPAQFRPFPHRLATRRCANCRAFDGHRAPLTDSVRCWASRSCQDEPTAPWPIILR